MSVRRLIMLIMVLVMLNGSSDGALARFEERSPGGSHQQSSTSLERVRIRTEYAPAPKVIVNGTPISIPLEQEPYISPRSNRLLFPLRAIFDLLGLRVRWAYPADSRAKIAWVETPDTLIGLPIDQDFLYFDGEPIYHGIHFDSASVHYLNRIALLHEGQPPRSVLEATNETIATIIDSILLAELFGVAWIPQQSAERTGKLVTHLQRQVAGFKPPERTGFAHPPGGQHMSEASIRWQSEVTGKP